MWTPVLDGELADTARRVVREIGEDLMRVEVEHPCRADVALLWAYAAGTFDDAAAAQHYADSIAKLVDSLGGPSELGLFGGLAGAGWVLAHVGDNAGELLAAIDRKIVDAIPVDRWEGHYDLVGGLVGLGVYFLERLADPDSLAPEGLSRVVDHLIRLAANDATGATWFTPARLLTAENREQRPDGDHDCGVAHGMPAVIALLGRITALPDPPREVRALCRDAMRWLRARELSPGHGGRFPYGTALGMRARTAWCYGDPGIAVTGWSAAARVGDDVASWRSLAREVALRDPAHCGVRDAGLCHGALGLAHMCNRFFQASGDQVFATAARGWFERGLAMRAPAGCGGAEGASIGGFRAPHERSISDSTWYACDDLLVGASGIGLSLLAGLATEEPGWDRLLLCDLPPR